MKRSGLLLPGLILPCALTACATPAPVTTSVAGDAARLATAGAYRLEDARPDAPEAAQAARRAVEAALARQGWTPRADTPDVLAEVSYGVRPGPVGAFAGQARPETADDGWLEAPRPRRWWRGAEETRVLALRLLDPATARPIVEAVATGRAAPGAESPDPARLAEALFQPTGSSTTNAPPASPPVSPPVSPPASSPSS